MTTQIFKHDLFCFLIYAFLIFYLRHYYFLLRTIDRIQAFFFFFFKRAGLGTIKHDRAIFTLDPFPKPDSFYPNHIEFRSVYKNTEKCQAP
jgi:hypothetical protein